MKKRTETFKLPDITQQPIEHVDGTPDNLYPLRILRAYRENCNCMWSESTNGLGSQKSSIKVNERPAN